MSLVREFKEFLVKQNALALAVAVIIGLVVFMIIKYALPKPEAAPSTKECAQCKTLIPAAATRCNSCTQPVA